MQPKNPDQVIVPHAENGPKINKQAHQPTEADRAEVRSMAGLGATQDSIAVVKRIDVKTLRKHYAEELSVGYEQGNMKLLSAQWENAVNKMNPAMQIWLGKQRLGQTDKIQGQGMGDINIDRRVQIAFVDGK